MTEAELIEKMARIITAREASSHPGQFVLSEEDQAMFVDMYWPDKIGLSQALLAAIRESGWEVVPVEPERMGQ